MEANHFHPIARNQQFSSEKPIQPNIKYINVSDQAIIQIAENLQLIKKNPSQFNSQNVRGKYIPPNMSKALEIYNCFKSTSHDGLVRKNLKSVLFDAIAKKVNTDLKLNELASLCYMLDYIGFASDPSKERVYKSVIEQLDSKLNWDNRECLSHCAWATFALRDVKMQNKIYYFERFRSIIQAYYRSLTPFEVSLVVRGFKTAGFESSFLLNSLRNLTINNRKNLKSVEIVRTLRAFAYSKQETKEDRDLNLRMFQIFQPTLIGKMDELSVKKAIRISRIFAEMNIVDTNLFNAIWNKIEPDIEILTADQLTFITKSFLNTDQNNNTIPLKILKAIEIKHNENEDFFNTWALSKITYAALIKFCNFNDENFVYYKQFIHGMLLHFSKTKPSDWDKASLSRLGTIVEIYKEKYKDSNQVMISRLENLTSLIPPSNNSPTSSDLHLDVMEHLDNLLHEKKWPSKMKSECAFYEFALDIAFRKKKFAIEIDGPCHLDENGEYMPKNILKETLLALKGWKLVRIKHSEWPGMVAGKWNGFDQEKRDFLLSEVEPYLAPCETEFFEVQDDEFGDESYYDYDPISEEFCEAQQQINDDLKRNHKHYKKLLQKCQKPRFGKGA